MEDIIERVRYPSAPLTKCRRPPIDDGEITALITTEDRVWAVQCKCYAPARKVGPEVVRELAGSLHRYPEGTCGMIVTTSSFTPSALEEAMVLNIKAIDGLQFVALGNSTCTREL